MSNSMISGLQCADLHIGLPRRPPNCKTVSEFADSIFPVLGAVLHRLGWRAEARGQPTGAASTTAPAGRTMGGPMKVRCQEAFGHPITLFARELFVETVFCPGYRSQLALSWLRPWSTTS